MEELEYGEPRQRHPRLLAAAVIALTLVVALCWWLDRQWEGAATADVTAAASHAEMTVTNAQRRLDSMRDYVRPAISRPDLDPAMRTSMEELIDDARNQGLLEIDAARAALLDLSFAPWHDGPRRLRDEAVATLEAGRVTLITGSSGANSPVIVSSAFD